MADELLDALALEKSHVVANSAMNRGRRLRGGNSYEKELGFDPAAFLRARLQVQQHASWLDLGCGAGRALLDAAEFFRAEATQGKVTLVGVDLIPMFYPMPADIDCLRFEAASLSSWQSSRTFDVITCVHGLHYVGDKLGLVQRAVQWLNEGGRFLAHLDYSNLRLKRGSAHSRIGKDLARAGLEYNSRRHLLSCQGPRQFSLAYRYLGASDGAGPNYTGQPAVNSFYEAVSPDAVNLS
jgi:SAM-dependent methyltransferase